MPAPQDDSGQAPDATDATAGNAAAPEAAAPEATKKRRRWRRRLLIAAAVLLIVGFFLPAMLAPYVRSKLETTIASELQMEGSIADVSLSWFSGVRVLECDFQSETETLVFARLDSDLSIGDLLSSLFGDHWNLGDEIHLVDPRVVLDLRPKPTATSTTETKPEPESTNDSRTDPFRMSVPRIQVSNASFSITLADGKQFSLDESTWHTQQLPPITPAALGDENAMPLVLRLIGAAQLRCGANIDDTTVRDLKIQGSSDGKTCSLTFDGFVNDGETKGTAALTAETWRVTASSSNVQTSTQLIDTLARVSPFFVLVKQAPTQPRCLIGCDLDLNGKFGVAAPLETLNGLGTLRTSAGDVEIAESWRGLVALVDRKNQSKSMLFRPFEQPFRLSDGKILNEGFELASEHGSLLVNGYTTVSGALHHDLSLDKELAAALDKNPELKILADSIGSQVIRLRGTVSAPTWEFPTALTTPGKVIEDLLKPGGAGEGAIKKGLDGLIDKGLDDLFDRRKKKSGADQR